MNSFIDAFGCPFLFGMWGYVGQGCCKIDVGASERLSNCRHGNHGDFIVCNGETGVKDMVRFCDCDSVEWKCSLNSHFLKNDFYVFGYVLVCCLSEVECVWLYGFGLRAELFAFYVAIG